MVMEAIARPRSIDLEVTDVSAQKRMRVRGVPADSMIGDVIEKTWVEMGLPKNDASGRPLTYRARLEREGRHLFASETVGEALEANDRLVLQPEITAG